MKYKYIETQIEELTIEDLKKICSEDIVELDGKFELDSILTIPKIHEILRKSTVLVDGVNLEIRYNPDFYSKMKKN